MPLLVPSPTIGAVTPNGFLTFVEDGVLKAQAIDADRMQLVGPRIAVGAGAGQPFATLASSANNRGMLAYTISSPDSRQLTWFDRSGHQLGIIADRANYVAPVISPDQTKVAVGIDLDIWLIDLARANTRTRLTTDASSFYPVWSPDGRRIVYSSGRADAPGLYVRSATSFRQMESG